MDVQVAEERVFRIPDQFSLQHGEGRAWAKRLEAFGALARVAGLFSPAKDDEFEVIYRERRLQPFWRISVSTRVAYERQREYRVSVAPDVVAVRVGEIDLIAQERQFVLQGVETCLEETSRTTLVDGLLQQTLNIGSPYLQFEAEEYTSSELAATTHDGVIVVPPQAKASLVVRDAISAAIGKFDADRVIEEHVTVDAVDLYYRPVFAFRYRRLGKEAVVEFDAVTGETKVGGATFEQYLGKVLEPKFLLDVGAETLNMVLPGANLAKMMIVKGIEMKRRNQS